MPGIAPYRRILAAVDLIDDSRVVAERAADIARSGGGTLHLLHVVEYVPPVPVTETMMPPEQIDPGMIERARTLIAALAASLGLPATSSSVEVGSAKGEVLRYARERQCDLIVLGSRERHGLSILINRTEDTVLHGAPCDVLAVRVP
jgi:universal stress protein A